MPTWNGEQVLWGGALALWGDENPEGVDDLDSLVPLAVLLNKLDRVLDEAEQRDASDALEDATELVRYHGRSTWTDVNAPRLAKKMVIRSVKRYLKNTDGYSQSRAGDETVAWEHAESAPYLTDAEQKMVAQAAGRGSLRAVPISPWGELAEVAEDVYVPVSGGGKPFPWWYGTLDGPL
jgi:hypothetical protein